MKHYAEMHLYRGAPAVRGWSRYQQTMRDWTLCGISPTASRIRRRAASKTRARHHHRGRPARLRPPP